MPKPDVTIVMSPRERFHLTRRSIESLYDDQGVPFDFICVDGGSPRAVRNYLRAESRRRNFKLIRTPHYLAPNEARNLALDEVKTRYTVFVDNDVVVAPGWLDYLVRCADETNAAIVSPLTCIGEPVHTTIHMAGGEASVIVEGEQRLFHETHRFPNRPIAEVRDQLVRELTELAEFHCMLVRTEWLARLGPFDENLKATFEHDDFCMLVRQQGGVVMIEPRSLVTQVFGPPLSLSELKFFYCRWSDEWAAESERYFHKKWGTVFDDRVLREYVVHHRRHALPGLRRAVRALAGWRISEWVLYRVEDFFVWRAMRDRAVAPGSPPREALARKIHA